MTNYLTNYQNNGIINNQNQIRKQRKIIKKERKLQKRINKYKNRQVNKNKHKFIKSKNFHQNKTSTLRKTGIIQQAQNQNH
jgi:hypothetical protein